MRTSVIESELKVSESSEWQTCRKTLERVCVCLPDGDLQVIKWFQSHYFTMQRADPQLLPSLNISWNTQQDVHGTCRSILALSQLKLCSVFIFAVSSPTKTHRPPCFCSEETNQTRPILKLKSKIKCCLRTDADVRGHNSRTSVRLSLFPDRIFLWVPKLWWAFSTNLWHFQGRSIHEKHQHHSIMTITVTAITQSLMTTLNKNSDYT